MSARDIIDTAVNITDPFGHGSYFKRDRFSQTFNPEHVVLMEAVCEAACALPCCDMQLDFPTGTCRECVQEPVCASTEALQAYREERGL